MKKPKQRLSGVDEIKEQAVSIWKNEWVQLGMDAFYFALFIKGYQDWNKSNYAKAALIFAGLSKIASLADNGADFKVRKKQNGN